jgi:hypothetical protein
MEMINEPPGTSRIYLGEVLFASLGIGMEEIKLMVKVWTHITQTNQEKDTSSQQATRDHQYTNNT